MAYPIVSSVNHFAGISPSESLDVHLFSKHLHFLDVAEASKVAAEIGFAGLDLTVRPKGHVLPENVKKDLPKAIRQINRAGIVCNMITTAVDDADDPIDVDVIKTAADQGVKYYRSNWFKYKADRSLPESLAHYRVKIRQLSSVNQTHNIIGCYQNHSGTSVGASVWEIYDILKMAHADFFGVQYDIRHAVAEGGRSWTNGVNLLHEQIKTIVLKDFKWGKVDGKWKIVNVPIGEGMVDFTKYFQLLKGYGLRPPVSLHLEYPLGGAEKGKSEITIDPEEVYAAMRQDLAAIQDLWNKA